MFGLNRKMPRQKGPNRAERRRLEAVERHQPQADRKWKASHQRMVEKQAIQDKVTRRVERARSRRLARENNVKAKKS